MTERKGNSTDSTVLGLPEIESSPELTAPSLPPVPSAPELSPKATIGDTPRRKTGAVPQAQPAARRPSRIAAPPPADPVSASDLQDVDEAPSTDPAQHIETTVRPVPPPAAMQLPDDDGFEWTMGKVAALAGSLAVVAIIAFLFWPVRATRPAPVDLRPLAVEAPSTPPPPEPVAAVKPVAPPAPAPSVAPEKPAVVLDARDNVVDPFGVHLEDLPLDPGHKYRLRIERDDSRLGTVLARLDEKNGWGVMHRMASHAALQFGGAKTLRLHCEPGRQFFVDQHFPLELVDLATRQKIPLALEPARHCWDLEVMRRVDLGVGVRQRLRVPTETKAKLGDGVNLKVVYVLEGLGERTEWRTGVLHPGESVLAEGRFIRLAILDSYAGDNDGTVALEVLPPDTQSSGLVTPGTGVQFVPTRKQDP